MRMHRADAIPFLLGAIAGTTFTFLLLSSASPPIALPLAIAMVVGSFVTGGWGLVWMRSGAAARLLATWDMPTPRPLVWRVAVTGAIGCAAIWSLGLSMIIRSLD